MNWDKFRFYVLLGKEILFFPFLYLSEWKKNRKERILVHTTRKSVLDSTIYVSIHEWGGYPSLRKKKIRDIQEFECGLQYQLERFKQYKGDYQIDITVTISDAHLCNDLSFLNKQVDHIITVSNAGMDFSGYEAFYKRIKEQPNSYIILTNSSVNVIKKHFLDGYIQYMNQNPDIGILGVSYNSKCYQSLIRNNFNPHIQSFFLLTTIEVLNEIVDLNHHVFPGKGIRHKLLLIRKGELGLSSLALKLGYALAVVREDGSVLKFDRYTCRDAFLSGDMRKYVNNPNSINPIV